MLVSEVIERIQALYSKGVKSDDSRLSSRHIYSKLLTVRSKLVSQKLKKYQRLSQWTYQELSCVEMVEAHPNECPCVPPKGCKILKSKYPIPKTLLDFDKHVIQSVTTLDGLVQFDEVLWEELKYKYAKKYTKKSLDYFIKNEHLYLTTSVYPVVVKVTGIFEDPFKAEIFKGYCSSCENCVTCTSPLDMEFSIDSSLIDPLVEMSVNELVGVFNQGQEDKTNNTADTRVDQSK